MTFTQWGILGKYTSNNNVCWWYAYKSSNTINNTLFRAMANHTIMHRSPTEHRSEIQHSGWSALGRIIYWNQCPDVDFMWMWIKDMGKNYEAKSVFHHVFSVKWKLHTFAPPSRSTFGAWPAVPVNHGALETTFRIVQKNIKKLNIFTIESEHNFWTKCRCPK